jgi:signal transduction histidine kinase
MEVTLPDRPILDGNPFLLYQALENLVQNAIEFSPSGGTVSVTVVNESDRMTISVADEGPGIPAEEQERIFEPGARLNEGLPGSGLGLAIARAVAVAHGGELTVASSPGRGATFTLVLPRRNGI